MVLVAVIHMEGFLAVTIVSYGGFSLSVAVKVQLNVDLVEALVLGGDSESFLSISLIPCVEYHVVVAAGAGL